MDKTEQINNSNRILEYMYVYLTAITGSCPDSAWCRCRMSRVSRPVATPGIILVFARHQTPRITQHYPPESHLAAAGSVFRMGLNAVAVWSAVLQLSAHYIARCGVVCVRAKGRRFPAHTISILVVSSHPAALAQHTCPRLTFSQPRRLFKAAARNENENCAWLRVGDCWPQLNC